MDFEALRKRQQQRVEEALRSLDEARQALRNAISATETRERELQDVSADVQRRLEALALVEEMSRGIHTAPVERQPDGTVEGISKLIAATSTPAELRITGLIHTSSRPLFPSARRSKASELSILQ